MRLSARINYQCNDAADGWRFYWAFMALTDHFKSILKWRNKNDEI